MKKSLVLLFLLGLIGLPYAFPSSPKADPVLRNGLVYTMDAPWSWAESIAIQGGKIVYVGPDSGIEAWIGPSTTTINLGGHFVLPGFIDGHVHPISAGMDMDKC